MDKREISLIAARSRNNVIGKKGQIPWKIHRVLTVNAFLIDQEGARFYG